MATKKTSTKPVNIKKTFVVTEDQVNKITAISHWERIDIKDVVSTAFSEYIAKYEKKGGPVKPVPGKK